VTGCGCWVLDVAVQLEGQLSSFAVDFDDSTVPEDTTRSRDAGERPMVVAAGSRALLLYSSSDSSAALRLTTTATTPENTTRSTHAREGYEVMAAGSGIAVKLECRLSSFAVDLQDLTVQHSHWQQTCRRRVAVVTSAGSKVLLL
jgi:hypothetical protein